MNLYVVCYSSPIGTVRITGTDDAVVSVAFSDADEGAHQNGGIPPVLLHCVNQLDEYFRGVRTDFSVPLHPMGSGTEFQQRVWQVLRTVPFGHTASYAAIASRCGRGNAIRATGAAIGSNPWAILLPCHRVVGKRGELRGYAWGTWRKEWLLNHEKRVIESGRGGVFATP